MRNDVQRLSRELQRQQANARHHEQAREVDHLRRCENELQGLIETLDNRRRTLMGEPPILALTDELRTPISAFSPSVTASHQRPAYDRSAHAVGDNGKYHSHSAGSTQPSYDPCWLNGWQRTITRDPVLEARVSHLARRRDQLAARAHELEDGIAELERQLQDMQAHRHRWEDEGLRSASRRELDGVEQRIRDAETFQRRRAEADSLERQVEQMRRQLAPSEILREASSILSRLTGRAHHGLWLNDRGDVWVEDDRGQRLSYGTLSRGTQDQVYLALALALVAAYRRLGVELPLVVNEIFANTDTDRTQATIDVLAAFAARGHQVILFTRHEHPMAGFAQVHARLYTLRERDRAIAAHPEPIRSAAAPHDNYYLDELPRARASQTWGSTPDVTSRVHDAWSEPRGAGRNYNWVAHWETPRRSRIDRTDVDLPPTANGDWNDHELRESTPLAELPIMDGEQLTQLRELGIYTVGQYLGRSPEEFERRGARGSTIARALCQSQSQLALQFHVGLAASDAALLVACGIHDPEELSYVDVSELHRRIEEVLAHGDSRGRYGSIARFERSRLARWIQAARRSHYRRQRPEHNRPHAERRLAPTQRSVHRVESPDESSATRIDEPRSSLSLQPPRPAAEEASGEILRFFLDPSDPVVDAPSIGPKTAERFQAIGVNTVAELLELDATEAAERINYRRISPQLVQSWQKQTCLVCQVPNLRGHDAQILVACDISTPEQLAQVDAEGLLEQVKQYVRSADGKRVLRSAKAPDMAEVVAWIRWAQHRRTLQAAR
jgi:hypothetical protein